MSYCQLDQNNQVISGPQPLPQRGVRRDGARTGNLEALDTAQLREYGWVKANIMTPAYDSQYYTVQLASRVFNSETQQVDCTYEVIELPLEQVKGIKISQVQQEAIRRLALLYPVLSDAQLDISDINLVGELLSDAVSALDTGNVPVNLTKAKALYLLARQSVDSVKALNTFDEVKAFDPLNDVAWPND